MITECMVQHNANQTGNRISFPPLNNTKTKIKIPFRYRVRHLKTKIKILFSYCSSHLKTKIKILFRYRVMHVRQLRLSWPLYVVRVDNERK